MQRSAGVEEVGKKSPGGYNVNNDSTSSLLLNPVEPSYYGTLSTTPSECNNDGGSEISDSLSGIFQFDIFQFDTNIKQRCKKLFLNRVPKGKAAFVVFLINILEGCAFYSALKIVNYTVFDRAELGSLKIYFIFNVFQYTAGRVFYPLAGMVADVYLGRNRVIHIGLWLFWTGFAIILLVLAADLNRDISSHWFKLLPILATVLFMFGSACIEATIIPFGMDQIEQGAPSEELSSYFFWYYFGRQLGYILNILLSMFISFVYYIVKQASQADEHDEEKNVDLDVRLCVENTVILMLVTVSILLHFSTNSWFFKAKQRANPLWIIFGVLFFAMTVKRHAPRYRRSFRYGEGRLPRIELAKVEYDGKYSSEEVEDVKTFVRVLFIIFCLGFTFASFGAISAMYPHMIDNARTFSVTVPTGQQIKFDLFLITETMIVCLAIPVLNHLVLPFNPGLSMKRRLGVGVFFLLLSVVIAMVIEILQNRIKHLLLWLLLPTALFAIADMLIFVTGLEFIYAQSPDSMKGLLTGIFYFIFGVFAGVGILIYYKLNDSIMDFFYVILAVSLVGLVVYILGALWYRNRERPTNDESEQDLWRRNIAANVYLEKH